MLLREITPLLQGVKRGGRGIAAKCPAHDDSHQSLSVCEGEGRILLKCFAGCSTETIVKALGLTWKDLFDKNIAKPSIHNLGESVNKTVFSDRSTGVMVFDKSRVSPCPIAEAVCEFRFETDMPNDAVFGVVHQELKDAFPVLERLPILQIPESVRLADANLQVQPHYKLSNDKFLVQVGPNVLSINVVGEYPGWPTFQPEIASVLSTIDGLGLVKHVTRLGLRYVNLFEEPVIERLNVGITVAGRDVCAGETFIRTILREGSFQIALQIANRGIHTVPGKPGKEVSVLDIDVACEEDLPALGGIPEILEKAHDLEKGTFYGLLKADFLQQFRPEYE